MEVSFLYQFLYLKTLTDTQLANTIINWISISYEMFLFEYTGYSGPLMTRLFVMSCDSTMPVMPDVRMNDCAMKAGKANFSATVQLDTPVGRGCDRNRYEASGRYRICGAEGFIDLLPKPWKGQEWTKKLKTVKNSDGKKGLLAYFNFFLLNTFSFLKF